MSGSRHPGVPGSLGRVLAQDELPVGTCFQVTPGILVTARHVLADLGRADAGCEVLTDALDGSTRPAPSRVVAVDSVHDLAVLHRPDPLPGSVAGWLPTDSVPLLTKVVVNGVVEVDDPGHTYEFLHATGEWQGGTVRDGVPLGRLSSAALMPGMSGAPVLRVRDGLVLGVVSARYNSADHWLRDSVWVTRTEDLTRLLTDAADVVVRQRLVLGDHVGTVLSAYDPALTAVRSGSSELVGPVEAAREAALVLTALDDACRGPGALDGTVELIISRVSGGGWDDRDIDDLRHRLRMYGLDPRVLLPRLTDHDEALRRWAQPLPGTPVGHGMSAHAAHAIAKSIRRILAEELRSGFFAELSGTCRDFLREALEDGDAAPPSGFLHALPSRLPPLRPTSVQAVHLGARHPHTRHHDEGAAHGPRTGTAQEASDSVGPAPGRPELSAVAVQMCRLPAPDPCTAGRERLVAKLAAAVYQRMSRYGAATAFLYGQPGAGTSVVAIEAARALAPGYPGGVFYIDLHGLVPDACLNARTVVRLVAEALRLDFGTEMRGDAEVIASFTAQLHDRRVLLLLDNARDAAQVRPFVKAPTGCGVIVTSRNRAQDYADPRLVFEVGPLKRHASVEVLTRCAEGVDGVVSDSGASSALHRLAHLCGDIPLALRIVGARLAQPSGPGPDYLVQLLEEESTRLDALSYGDRAVRLAIRLSHDTLDPATRRILRLITAAPGAATTGQELGHCLAAPALRQELLLNRLVDHSLALQDIVRMPTGRLLATFHLFDLVRLFAAERLAMDEPPEVVREFQHSSVGYLCARLAEITDQAHGAQLSGELDPTRFHAALRLAQHHGWLDLAADLTVGLHVLYTARGELDSVIAVNHDRIALYLRQGRPAEAVRACLLNTDTLRSAGSPAAAADAARQAGGIAREYRLGDFAAEAEFKLSLALWDQGAWRESLAAGEQAVAILTSIARPASAAPVAINNSRIARRMGDTEAAVRWGRSAVELAEQCGIAKYQAMAHNQWGSAEFDAGNETRSLHLHRRAAELWEGISNLANAAHDYCNAAHSAQNDPATAAHLFRRAADLWQRSENHLRAVESLIDLSSVYAAEEDYPQAASALTRAERMMSGVSSDAPPLLRSEVLLRCTAARLFTDGTAPPPDTGQARAATEAATGDEELNSVRTVLERHRLGRLSTAGARQAVRPLLTGRTRHRAPRDAPWVYEEWGEEPMGRPVLDA